MPPPPTPHPRSDSCCRRAFAGESLAPSAAGGWEGGGTLWTGVVVVEEALFRGFEGLVAFFSALRVCGRVFDQHGGQAKVSSLVSSLSEKRVP